MASGGLGLGRTRVPRGQVARDKELNNIQSLLFIEATVAHVTELEKISNDFFHLR